MIGGIDKDVAEYDSNQFTIAKGRKTVLSPFNQQGDKYIDTAKNETFEYDHINQKVSNVQPYEEESNEIVSGLSRHLESYIDEHFPSESGFGIYPQANGSTVVVIVDSKYNPSNYWSGRWKSWYKVEPSGTAVKGVMEIDIHFYEDGNIRLKTKKDITFNLADKAPESLISAISKAEDSYQDHLNKAFLGLNEGPFKALRRQLPVTRSKMTWGKAVGNYRLGKDIAGVGSE